jgi:hypothetical protein
LCIEYTEREVRRFWDLAHALYGTPISTRILERDISAFNDHPGPWSFSLSPSLYLSVVSLLTIFLGSIVHSNSRCEENCHGVQVLCSCLRV